MADIITISDDPAAALRRGMRSARPRPAGRHSDRDRLRACGRCDEPAGDRPHLRGQGAAAVQPADLPRRRHRHGGAPGVFDEASRRLAERFWPGPLTLVLPLAPGSPVHPLATAGLPSVGLRMPTGFARDLIAAFGRPLAAPSANTSGRVSPTTAAHVAADLGDRIELILDGGPAAVGVESTIVKIGPGRRPAAAAGRAAGRGDRGGARRPLMREAGGFGGDRGTRHDGIALCAGRSGAAECDGGRAGRGADPVRPRPRSPERTGRAPSSISARPATCSGGRRPAVRHAETGRRGGRSVDRRHADPAERARRGDQRPARPRRRSTRMYAGGSSALDARTARALNRFP